MKEMLSGLNRADVQGTLRRVEPQESYSEQIAQRLGNTVYGQPEACQVIGRRLALFESGLSDPRKPLGSIFEIGPTGVGKTEMAHAAADYMFGDPDSDRLKIINMSEMTEKHYITRFVGSPPSYVGYNEKPLIEHDWLHAGRSIVVLDEFEKAHPAIQQLFLGVLDKGMMDARKGGEGGKPLDFRQALIMFTANIAGKEIHDISEGGKRMGFVAQEPTEQEKGRDIQRVAEKGMKDILSPEFINRLDDIVVFQEIRDRVILDKILSKFIDQRNEQLVALRAGEAPYFAVTSEFRDFVLDSVGMRGGREMKRQLERQLFDKAADVFMGVDVRGKPLVADHDPEDGVVFYTDDSEPTVEAVGKKNNDTLAEMGRLTPGTEVPIKGETPKPPLDSGTDGKQTRTAGDDEGGKETPKDGEGKPPQGDPGDENDADKRRGRSDLDKDSMSAPDEIRRNNHLRNGGRNYDTPLNTPDTEAKKKDEEGLGHSGNIVDFSAYLAKKKR